MNTDFYSISLARLGIEPEFTILVADIVSTLILIVIRNGQFK